MAAGAGAIGLLKTERMRVREGGGSGAIDRRSRR